MTRAAAAATLLLCALLTACAGGGRARGTAGERAADAALTQLGKPYRFGGSDPDKGFDCSGLVHYSYAAAGVSVPRSTEVLYRDFQKVSAKALRRGDLVFFNVEGKKSSHVGIYLGRGEFVHAPSSGGRVRRESLDAAYWREHYAGARRP